MNANNEAKHRMAMKSSLGDRCARDTVFDGY